MQFVIRTQLLDFLRQDGPFLGINMAIRHTRQSQTSQGGRMPKAMPVDLSNLAMLDGNGKATRVGFRVEDGKKVRYAKTTGEAI